MEHRHITLTQNRTTVCLEADFWDAIEQLSGGNWKEWSTHALINKPPGVGRAVWLRCQVLSKFRDSGKVTLA